MGTADDGCKDRTRAACRDLLQEYRDLGDMIATSDCILNALNELYDEKIAPVNTLFDEGKITREERRERFKEFKQLNIDMQMVESRIPNFTPDDDKWRQGKSRKMYLDEIVAVARNTAWNASDDVPW